MKKITLSLIALSLIQLSCSRSSTPEMKAEPNNDLIQDMMEQDALKAQDFDPTDRKKPSSRIPPEGTVPVGFKPYKYKAQPESAEKNLKNPFSGDSSLAILEVGSKKYNTYCAVCHGNTGMGDGPVSVKMALKPPSLVSDKVKKFADGRIFHIITDGQGVMSSYAYQLVDENDRWKIVNYIRSLQKRN